MFLSFLADSITGLIWVSASNIQPAATDGADAPYKGSLIQQRGDKGSLPLSDQKTLNWWPQEDGKHKSCTELRPGATDTDVRQNDSALSVDRTRGPAEAEVRPAGSSREHVAAGALNCIG
ncbi:hypothetical protein DFH09DRAFT_1096333 [Mycena vulgaris]|nr:hypothetical protein DFH09DRAFT_1096333 [Mycena vulgaris]